jgi:hypothetical protein
MRRYKFDDAKVRKEDSKVYSLFDKKVFVFDEEFLFQRLKPSEYKNINYSYRIIVAGSILVIRNEGPIIMSKEAIKVPAFKIAMMLQLNNTGTESV